MPKKDGTKLSHYPITIWTTVISVLALSPFVRLLGQGYGWAKYPIVAIVALALTWSIRGVWNEIREKNKNKF
jgi:heme O synthase-like polyprenyltransferase